MRVGLARTIAPPDSTAVDFRSIVTNLAVITLSRAPAGKTSHSEFLRLVSLTLGLVHGNQATDRRYTCRMKKGQNAFISTPNL